MRERRRTQSGRGRRVHEAGDIVRFICRHASTHKIERTQDAGQKVIEVMGNTARELANHLHLLRLSKGFLRCRKLDFRSSLGCDVPTGAIYKIVLLNAHPRNPTVTAILASIAIDETDCRLTNQSQLKAGPR